MSKSTIKYSQIEQHSQIPCNNTLHKYHADWLDMVGLWTLNALCVMPPFKIQIMQWTRPGSSFSHSLFQHLALELQFSFTTLLSIFLFLYLSHRSSSPVDNFILNFFLFDSLFSLFLSMSLPLSLYLSLCLSFSLPHPSLSLSASVSACRQKERNRPALSLIFICKSTIISRHIFFYVQYF